MNAFRWWLFKRLSEIGWRICPEPQRTDLQYVMPSWGDLLLMKAIDDREKALTRKENAR